MTIATSTKIVPNACIWYHLVIPVIKLKPIFQMDYAKIGPLMPTLAHFQIEYAKLGLSCPLWPIKVDFDFIQRIHYLFDSFWEFLTYIGFIIPYW